jgi:hypothetical protein
MKNNKLLLELLIKNILKDLKSLTWLEEIYL